jgi:citronellol/citronellal dehydrogenase
MNAQRIAVVAGGGSGIGRGCAMRLAGEGWHVVVVVANLWRKGAPTLAHSAAARAAVVNLVRTLAVEWASKGIRVNAVSPGFTDTSALLERFRRLVSTVPLGRIGSVEEVVDAILFMASATYVTGEVLTVDGGLHLV